MIKLDADIIRKLYPNVVSTKTNSDGTRESYDSNGDLVDVDYEKVNKEYDLLQYQRDRIYPEIGDQLDMIYWDKVNGTENWKEAIDKVKADHTKPE